MGRQMITLENPQTPTLLTENVIFFNKVKLDVSRK